MFKHQVRAHLHLSLAALAAAVSFTGLVGTSQAAPIQWDPSGTGTYAVPVGGPGNFNNSDTNFVDSTDAQVAAASTSDVVFSGTGGAVTVNGATTVGTTNAKTGTVVKTLTLSPTTGDYTFGGSAAIILGTSSGGTVLTQTSGNNTITATVAYITTAGGTQTTFNVAAGTLTLSSLSYDGNGYGGVTKSGNGVLVLDGTFSMSGSLATNQGFNITGGTGLINTTALPNLGAGGFSVQSGATLGGSRGVALYVTGASDVYSGGHLAPGNNPVGANFGTVGAFTIQGAHATNSISTATLDTGSELDLDLVSTSSYDSVVLTKDTYGQLNFIIGAGTIVNINDGVGPLDPGTYHIITMAQLLNAQNGAAALSITDGGLVTGDVPTGYSYDFEDILGTSGLYNGKIIGVDLVVTEAAVPEPASLGLLGIGGLMLLRKRRRAC